MPPPARPVRPPFGQVILLLQGGGALGAYQAGAYQALHEAGIEPDWIAGISIGAINTALIAGNAPENRIRALRSFWETVTSAAFDWPYLTRLGTGEGLLNQIAALGTMFQGAPGFFDPRLPPPFLQPSGTPGAISYYDVSPLRATLGRLVDFALPATAGPRVSLGAVNIRTGQQVWFDSTQAPVGIDHVVASCALPPSFPPAEIDGVPYWDGGVVSNTPLQWVMDNKPKTDTLVFQLDLWNPEGEPPRDLAEVENRIKDIRYSSRISLAIDLACREHAKRTPKPDHALSIVRLIYRTERCEGVVKDFDFSRQRMEQHWSAGYRDVSRALSDPGTLEKPANPLDPKVVVAGRLSGEKPAPPPPRSA